MEYSFNAYFEASCYREKQLLQRKFGLDRDNIVRQHFAGMRRWSTFSKSGYCGVVITDPTSVKDTNLLFVVTSAEAFHDVLLKVQVLMSGQEYV